ncbi:hypothetical protein [Lentzea tibetensis]|uniref:hypothetical protein n=1 Tax=Lentzea tibetensis TaxID=2591470 RepID=UPI001F1C2B22|nr:hypothetical protein [Lentzea tibetensis]
MTHLLSDESADVTGQLIRFANGRLFVIRQMGPKEDVAEFGALGGALEAPPAQRWL